MEEGLGTEVTLQDTTETPAVETPVSTTEEPSLTDEQKEELAVADEVKKLVTDKDPPGFQKRIDQAIRKWRTEERARIKAEKEGTETKAVLEEMRKHNEKLYRAIKEQTSAIKTSVDVQAEKEIQNKSETELQRIDQNIAYLKQERVKARQDMDYNKEATIDDQIDSLKERRLLVKQEVAKKPTQDMGERYERQVIATWKEDTSWFSPLKDGEPNPEYNPRMEKAAMEYDRYLTTLEKWKNVPIEDRLQEVKKKTEEKFEYEPKKYGLTKTPTIESGGGLPPPRKEQDTKLTEDETRVVKNLFPNMSLAEATKAYLEQKKYIAGGK